MTSIQIFETLIRAILALIPQAVPNKGRAYLELRKIELARFTRYAVEASQGFNTPDATGRIPAFALRTFRDYMAGEISWDRACKRFNPAQDELMALLADDYVEPVYTATLEEYRERRFAQYDYEEQQAAYWAAHWAEKAREEQRRRLVAR